ncbi:MAG: T9SS type A sorting domain-containing protein [candidate division Zixibacteria bacterium]|nr:T9SS type A sorting domain-containing protein [candidate division Zixibacteria bacterium]
MRQIAGMAFSIVVFFYIVSSATIIDIPNDYATIQEGINASYDGDTVLVQPGTYTENVNFNGQNIVLGSRFLTTGDASYISSTIIDGDSSGSVITLHSGEDSTTTIIGFTIQNGLATNGGGVYCVSSSPSISFNIISDNSAFDMFDGGNGGGIYCYYSNSIISNNVIRSNYASGFVQSFGGGIYSSYLSPTIKNNLIIQNLGDWGGGGIYVSYSDPLIQQNVIALNRGTFYGGGLYLSDANPMIINNTIYRNRARWNDGGGIFCDGYSALTVVNTIMWADSAAGENNEIWIDDAVYPVISYCDILGGWEGEGNIYDSPYFRDTDNEDFHLMAAEYGYPYDSPCIDAGAPDILDIELDSLWGMGTLISDMGAYGGGDSVQVGIDEYVIVYKKEVELFGCYPNPFNTRVSIQYRLAEPGHISIIIYDILGRQLEALVNHHQPSGNHRISWEAEDLPSGIYFYRIQAGDYNESKKMILLK